MSKTSDTRNGLMAGLVAYLIWGFLPVYFVTVAAAAPAEVLAHRVLWAVPFGALILTLRGQWREVGRALTTPSMLAWLILSAVFIAVNWFIYIWAIQANRIVETSLGYYINPLIHVLVGVVLLGERLRRLQTIAVLLAAIGVGILAVRGGQVPWVALALAFTFAAYAVIRKRVVIGAMPGLFIETSLMFPVAAVWFAAMVANEATTFVTAGASLQFWLVMAGPVTAIPLLAFTFAARRLMLTTIGFMQFIAPTLQFCTGLYYGETLTVPYIVCFCFIWTAVAIFCYDALRASRRIAPLRSSFE